MAEVVSEQMQWEKPKHVQAPSIGKRLERMKFLIGGVLILAVVAYLVISGTAAGARYFITVDNLLSNSDYVGQTVRISGAVIGKSISYDSQNLIIEFTIANIPDKYDDLATALHLAATDPNARVVKVRVENQVKPDLLQNEAQAIVTGTLGKDGVFHATELLLKCPSRFQEADPGKDISQSEGS